MTLTLSLPELPAIKKNCHISFLSAFKQELQQYQFKTRDENAPGRLHLTGARWLSLIKYSHDLTLRRVIQGS